MMVHRAFLVLTSLLTALTVKAFVASSAVSNAVSWKPPPTTQLFIFGGGGRGKIPNSPTERDNQAIAATKAAINKPKTSGFPLIECEFPPLKELNKLGDGSMRSANEVDEVSSICCCFFV